MKLFVLLFMTIEFLFGVFIIMAGIRLIKMSSAKKSLATYKKRKKQNLVENYFLLWKYPIGQKTTEWFIKMLGDRFATLYYKISGWFFIIASPVFIFAPFFQIPLLFM